MAAHRESLETRLQQAGNVVRYLRNLPVGSAVFPVVPTEFSNWRDEQLATRESVALFDQSHHMMSLFIKGPDALRLLSDVGVNSFVNFEVNQAKQLVVTNYDGRLIGDGILFYLEEEDLLLVGNPPSINWVAFQGQNGGYDVDVRIEQRSPSDLRSAVAHPTYYRYEVQGPKAAAVIEKLTGESFPDIKFFNMGVVNIAGKRVRALRHGMAGAPGLELFGPYADRELIRGAIVEAGRDFDLKQVGSRAYPTLALESAWIGWPTPAVYTGESMRAYREWLPADGFEAAYATVGGSFVTDNIEDYYVTPYELGYGSIVKFDHDFIGRAALEDMADRPHRRKVTLAWHKDDVAKVFASLFDPDVVPFKYIDLPRANYAAISFDKVSVGDRVVGFSSSSGYSHNERTMLSMAVLDPDIAVGTEVALTWGEENGGSSKPSVERHRQTTIRAIVSPAPYSRVVREEYTDEGWRVQGIS